MHPLLVSCPVHAPIAARCPSFRVPQRLVCEIAKENEMMEMKRFVCRTVVVVIVDSLMLFHCTSYLLVGSVIVIRHLICPICAL